MGAGRAGLSGAYQRWKSGAASAEITITTTSIHASRLPRGLVGRHQPELVVFDLGAGFIDRFSPVSIVVARDFSPPNTLHLDPGTTTMASRVASGLSAIGLNSWRHLPVFLPVQAAMTPVEVERWCDVIRGIGADPIVVRRPNAAAAGLGLEVDGHTYLMMEMGARFIELAVLVDGEVIASRSIRYLDGGWRTALDAVSEMLAGIDPDQELEVRDHGIHIYGPEREMAPYFGEMVGLILAAPSGNSHTVTLGTQRIARDILRWLPAS